MKPIAMITGAAGGVGQALARELHDSHTLVLVGRQRQRLQDSYGDEGHLIEADVSTAEGAAQAMRACVEEVGTPEALVNCAGAVLIQPLHRTSPQQYRECLAANLDSAFFSLQAFIDTLRQAGQSGAAVLISSVAAQHGVPNHEAVSLSKAGVEGLIRAASATYAPAGIRINGVAGGLMATPATEHLLGNNTTREGAERQYPLRGVGDPQELAGLIGYLLSARAGWITGQIWNYDGGFSAIRPLVK